MKKYIKFLITVFLMLTVVSMNAQNTENFIVQKEIDTSANSNQKKYTEVVFQFYNKKSKKQIKGMAINVNDVRVPTDLITGEAKVYLSKKKYRFSVHFVSWINSEILKLKIDPEYNYKIDVYLEPSKDPIATTF